MSMWAEHKRLIIAGVAVLALAIAGAVLWQFRVVREFVELTAIGSVRELRERPADGPVRSADRPGILLIGLDGVGRDLLYDALDRGDLPNLAALLGRDASGKFPRTHFEREVVTTLPSITLAAWTTMFTGKGPAYHGVVGNEFFDRTTRRFAAPAGVSVDEPGLVLANFTDSYLEQFLGTDTVYETMRALDPNVLVWVTMHHVHRGADRLLLTSRSVLMDAYEPLLGRAGEALLGVDDSTMDLYSTFDSELIEETVNELGEATPPDVLTVYLSGSDLYAHVAEDGPDEARKTYLRETIDPLIGKLRRALDARGELANRYVIVTSDHGHIEVVHDERHALEPDFDGDPPALLKKLGYRVRPFEAEVSSDDDFDAVFAYQGAFAYVYLADRSTCPNPGDVCDWRRPPRFEEDVLPVVRAFYENNRDGGLVPELRGTLDLVLSRRPTRPPGSENSFRVYRDGELLDVSRYLEVEPRPEFLDLEARLDMLAVGPHGDRAGDVLLLARSGEQLPLDERYYFATPYHSWHGSPAERDSRVPLIVHHPCRPADELERMVERSMQGQPYVTVLAQLMLDIRSAAPADCPKSLD